jgi:hypothetical protein
MRSPAPTPGRRGSGAQRMHTVPDPVPSAPQNTGIRDPTPEPALQDPAPARAPSSERGDGLGQAAPPGFGDTGDRPRHHPGPYRHRSPFPPPSLSEMGRPPYSHDRRLSPGPPFHALDRVSGGAGVRRGEGRRHSRSSWPRPCRRSAPPARPVELSAPVARDPPSSRAWIEPEEGDRDGLKGLESGYGGVGARGPERPTHEANSRGSCD